MSTENNHGLTSPNTRSSAAPTEPQQFTKDGGITLSRKDLADSSSSKMHGTLTLVDEIGTLTLEEQQTIPAWWLQLVTADPLSAVQIAIEHWRKALPTQLPRFLQVLESEGIDVVLVKATSDLYDGLGLLYAIETAGRGQKFIIGYPPTAQLTPPATNFSPEFQTFYTSLHDGIGYHLQVPMGIIRSGELIDWKSWSTQDSADVRFQTPTPVRLPNTETLFIVYDENTSACILVDTDPEDTDIWATDSGEFVSYAGKRNSVWELIDDWMRLRHTP
ncbi:hypothetical protein [Mycolicibacterium sp. TY81]|uniref:hypothetical protein n=1 Tax=Mycolicibacterium sp. TY81 TaxID=2759662 RepID=UPI001BB31C2C|nr:hypothetical protein [Mycolicibacterium sp. TY81]